MKKILFILPTLQGGGAEKIISNLFLEFNKKKYDTKLLVFDGSKKKFLVNSKLRIVNLKKKRITHGTFQFIKQIKKIKPDVIISTVSHLNLFLSLTSILLPKKIRIIVRESNFLSENINQQSNKLIMKFLYNFFYNRLDKCIVFSKKHMLDTLKNTNLDKEKINIIENPVNFNVIKSLSLKKINKKYSKVFVTKEKKLLILGSLSYQKGIDIILNALKFCKENFVLNIIGEGSEYHKLQNIIKNENLNKKVNLIPYQMNPYPFIKASDALILSSRYEGMSNVVMETLTINIPIYYFNNPGASTDLLNKTNNNFILKSKKPKYIASVIDNIKQKNKKTNSKILKKYDTKIILSKYEKMIDDLF